METEDVLALHDLGYSKVKIRLPDSGPQVTLSHTGVRRISFIKKKKYTGYKMHAFIPKQTHVVFADISTFRNITCIEGGMVV